ncbi:MAG: hypothetical protein AAGA96_08520 [Verrucomicrobiota bacterium]
MKAIVEDTLWTDYRPVKVMGIPMGRRMTVLRGSEGRILVWSPIPISPEVIDQLKALGGPFVFVFQNKLHDNHFDEYFEPFSDSIFVAPSRLLDGREDWPLTDLSDRPELLDGIEINEVGGMPKLEEHAFFHAETRTLIFADLFFNMERPAKGMGRWLCALADIGGEPRPSRLFRSFIADEAAFTSSLHQILKWDFDRIIPGHGEMIETGGKEVLKRAMARWVG